MSAVIKTGYQGFGSFHSDDVEVLVRQPDTSYEPPHRPFDVDDLLHGLEICELGASMRQHYMIDFDNWTFINHGAFGAPVIAAQQEADRWRRHCEAQPLTFLDRELLPHMVRVIRELAKHVNAQPQDLVLLPNATTGLNAIISSVALAPGDSLYMLDIGYGSVKKMLAEAAARAGAQVVLGHVALPASSEDDIVAAVEASIPERCQLAVFDVITSNTALLLPVERLVQLCRARNIPVLLDGAHALGQLPLDLTSLAPDYFVANCHKWLSAPRGSACMWVHPQRRGSVRPLVLSHGSGAGFTSDFVWDGNRDYSAQLAVSAALRFWQELGWERARSYMRQLLGQAVALLTEAWGSSTLAPLAMCGTMACVQLPAALAAGSSGRGTADSADAKFVQDRLHYEHKVECPVKCLAGRLYVRISAAPYNVLHDYQVLAGAVAQIAEAQQAAARGAAAAGATG